MGTDRYAYQSKLRRVSPMPKLLLTAVSLLLCLCCDSIAVGLATLVGMGLLTRLLGGLSLRVYLHFLKIPLAFLLIGSHRRRCGGPPFWRRSLWAAACGALTPQPSSRRPPCSARPWGQWRACIFSR